MSNNTVEDVLRRYPFSKSSLLNSPTLSGPPADFWGWVESGRDIVPLWWSEARDVELRRTWKKIDLVSSSIYNIIAKMAAIPFKIIPYDTTVKSHHRLAQIYEQRLRDFSEMAQGFDVSYSKFLEDLLTQDNGGFMLVLGEGGITSAFTGVPYGVMHLDAGRCQRTGHPIFPVIYHDETGKMYKIHYTRIMFSSQMPSPKRDMHGVGFCALSRMILTGQHLYDIARYEQEKLGSRPLNAVLVGSGITAKQIYNAFSLAQSEMDSEGYQRYARVIALGSTEKGIGLDLVNLSGLPENFDKEKSIVLAMASIALALGVDVRELWPGTGSGATKADALVQHLKARGRGPAHIIGIVERMFASRFLRNAPFLKMEFDYVDDQQDKEQATIRNIRSESRARDLENHSLSLRVAREKMLEAGEITENQFEDMELEDGRLPDGADVLMLFSSDDKAIRGLLNIGVPNITDIEMGNEELIIDKIQKRISIVNKLIFEARNSDEKRLAKQVLAALIKLRKMYTGELNRFGEPNNPREESSDNEESEDNTEDSNERLETSARRRGQSDDLSKMRKDADGYRNTVIGTATDLWLGKIGKIEFVARLSDAVTTNLMDAFLSGMLEAGILASEVEDGELNWIHNRIEEEIQYILPFASDIVSAAREGTTTQAAIMERARMWALRYEEIKSAAMTMAKTNPKLLWVKGQSEDGCVDCSRYDGRVYRASVWGKYNIAPKSRGLSCKGFKCNCQFRVVKDIPITPGRPPALSGG